MLVAHDHPLAFPWPALWSCETLELGSLKGYVTPWRARHSRAMQGNPPTDELMGRCSLRLVQILLRRDLRTLISHLKSPSLLPGDFASFPSWLGRSMASPCRN